MIITVILPVPENVNDAYDWMLNELDVTGSEELQVCPPLKLDMRERTLTFEVRTGKDQIPSYVPRESFVTLPDGLLEEERERFVKLWARSVKGEKE